VIDAADDDEGKGPPLVAFVLTGAAPPLDPPAIVKAYARLRRGAGTLAFDAQQESVATFHLKDRGATDGSLHVAVMPAPIPGDEVAQAGALSLEALGKEDPPSLAHEGHMIIMFHPAAPADDPAPSLRALTLAAAAVAEATRAVGIYWGPGGVAHTRELFVGAARRLDDGPAPLPIWCGLSIASDGERLSLLTVGFASQFAMPDILLSAPTTKVGDSISFAFDLLLYVLGRGTAIAEGETVGRTAQEKLKVTYVPSPVDPEVQVASIHLPG
jgi:hypothetical protein